MNLISVNQALSLDNNLNNGDLEFKVNCFSKKQLLA